jgi:hypothetical protein
MNVFDRYSKTMHSTVASLMGYTAVWTPYDNSVGAETATVLFRAPTRKEELDGVAYAPTNFMMEYHEGIFQNLKALADKASNERVTVDGTEYLVVSVRKIADGRTYIAKLETLAE